MEGRWGRNWKEGEKGEQREGRRRTDQIHSFGFLSFLLTVHKYGPSPLYVVARERGMMESFMEKPSPY